MQAQSQIDSIPCVIALDSETNSVAFQGLNATAFIDVWKEGGEAKWYEGYMRIEGIDYEYNNWHKLEGKLREYIQFLVERDYVPPMVFCGFNTWSN